MSNNIIKNASFYFTFSLFSDCRTNPCFQGVKCTTIKQYPGYTCENCPRYFAGNGVNCTRNGIDK